MCDVCIVYLCVLLLLRVRNREESVLLPYSLSKNEPIKCRTRYLIGYLTHSTCLLGAKKTPPCSVNTEKDKQQKVVTRVHISLLCTLGSKST